MRIVAIEKCESYDETVVYNSVKKGILNSGFVFPKNKKVLLKPNLLSQNTPDESVTTHPAVIDALCRICKENDCYVTIADSSGFYQDGGTKKSFETSGIKAVAEKHNVKWLSCEEAGSYEVKDDSSVILKSFNLSNVIKDADLIINVPKLKTHTLMGFTGAVKNLFGLIPGGLKQQCHIKASKVEDFADLLLDIVKHIPVQLNVMDGIIGLEGNGPGTGGIPKKTGLIIISEDSFCLDVVAQRIIGFNPNVLALNKKALSRGFLKDIEEIKVVGDEPKINYKKPVSSGKTIMEFVGRFIFNQAIITPYINNSKCKICRKCVQVCPVKAIKHDTKYPIVSKKECIHCYCCHEMCPYSAIDMKQGIIIEIARKIRDTIFGAPNTKKS